MYETLCVPRIVELEEAPQFLKELVISEASNITTIEQVIFGTFILESKGAVGMYYYDNNTIGIDMGNALYQMALYNKGMMFIPNVLCTIVWALGHEIQHALQVEVEPELKKFDVLPQEYEDAATQYGEELVLKWTEYNKLPDIEDLGWLTLQLKLMLNKLYYKHPDIVDELDFIKHNAAANILSVAASINMDADTRDSFIRDIKNKDIGVTIGKECFLTANELMGI